MLIVECRCSCIFQYCYVFDVFRVNVLNGVIIVIGCIIIKIMYLIISSEVGVIQWDIIYNEQWLVIIKERVGILNGNMGRIV